jgi:hypothetical protein
VPGAKDVLKATQQHATRSMKAKNFFLAYAIAHLAIPAYIATVAWNDIKAPPIVSLKHPHYTTARQRLQHTLANLQKQGIYRKFEHSE